MKWLLDDYFSISRHIKFNYLDLKITFENKSTILTDNKISKIDKSFLSRSVNVSTVMNWRSSSALLKKRNDFNPEYLKQITGVSSKVIKR